MHAQSPEILTTRLLCQMYPVGVLFGLGFDTASSIALLAVTAVAQQKVPQGAVAILPVRTVLAGVQSS